MNSWLESEEEKKAKEDERIAFEKQEKIKNEEILSQKQYLLHNNLNDFFNICARILKLYEYCLNIEKLSVYATSGERVNRFEVVHYKKEITFSASIDSNDILIKIRHYIYDDPRYDSKQGSNTLLVKKTICSQDLLDWKEERMINLIRWLISKSDFSKEDLPGRKEVLSKKSNWFSDWLHGN